MSNEIENVLIGGRKHISQVYKNKRGDIGETIYLLSLGRIEKNLTELPKAGSVSHEKFEQACDDALSEIQQNAQTALDLASLWQYALGGMRLDNWQKNDGALERIASLIGVDDMIDTYIAGVPAEDIIA